MCFCTRYTRLPILSVDWYSHLLILSEDGQDNFQMKEKSPFGLLNDWKYTYSMGGNFWKISKCQDQSVLSLVHSACGVVLFPFQISASC